MWQATLIYYKTQCLEEVLKFLFSNFGLLAKFCFHPHMVVSAVCNGPRVKSTTAQAASVDGVLRVGLLTGLGQWGGIDRPLSH